MRATAARCPSVFTAAGCVPWCCLLLRSIISTHVKLISSTTPHQRDIRLVLTLRTRQPGHINMLLDPVKSQPITNDSGLRIGPRPPDGRSFDLHNGENWMQVNFDTLAQWSRKWEPGSGSAECRDEPDTSRPGPNTRLWTNPEGWGLLCAVFTLDGYGFISWE